MANPSGNLPSNPFDHAFEMLGHMPEVTTVNVNAEALESLTQALTTRASERGRMVLLRSPRAGFGKTHLLMRLHQRVARTHEFIPLEPSRGRYLDAQSVLDAVLRRFSRVLPAGGGLTVLDLLARRILALGLEPLVKSGEVPSQERESALQALQLRPVETFDFHNDEAVTAQWAKSNFSLLGPRLTAELAERTHAGYRPVAWWVELLFRYSSASIDQSSRNSSLFETVFGGDSVETDMHEKLVTLLNLTGLVSSPVLILDEVEGFSSNPEAALQVATFLNALHQSCNKLALIISVNGDVWETAFLPRLPCGLKDRLSDIVIDLKPMDKEAAVSLLKDRAGDRAHAIADTMDFDSGVVYARGLVREAASAWEDISKNEFNSAAVDNGISLLDPISLLTPDVPEDIVQDDEPESVDEKVLHAPAAVVIPGTTQVPPVFRPNPTTEINPTKEMSGEPESGPSTDDRQAPEPPEAVVSFQSDQPSVPAYEKAPVFQPEEAIDSEPRPQLPADLPQPFGQHPASNPVQQDTLQSEPPHFDPPKEQPVEPSQPLVKDTQDTPANVGESSPFTIASDNESPAASPVVVPQNVIESPFAIDTDSAETPSPFQSVEPSQTEAPVEPAFFPQPDPSVAHTPQVPENSPFQVDEGKTPGHTVTDDDHDKVEDLLKQFRDRYGRD